jgi:signal transduction histidine kinase
LQWLEKEAILSALSRMELRQCELSLIESVLGIRVNASGSRRISMELVGTGGKVVLRVSDDGVGFDLNASQHQTGLGMTSMSANAFAL